MSKSSPQLTAAYAQAKHSVKPPFASPPDRLPSPARSEGETILTLSSLKRILQQSPKERTHASIASLMNFTKGIKFFKDLLRDATSDAHFQCCQHMKYEFIPSTQYVFHKGDSATKFYIILEGHCAVLVPLLAESGEVEYKTVTDYGPGDCFGELALVRNSHRTAGVVCRSDAHFAVLEQHDFNRIIGKVKELILEEKVNFLAQFPFFSAWPKGEMQRISYYFREQTYRRKQAVFRFGDDAASIYFIREGEFEILENIQEERASLNLRQTKVTSHFVEFTLLTKNQIFGEEDIISGCKVRSYSVICHSSTALLLIISKEDFLTRVSSEHALEYLNRVHDQKKTFRKSRLAAVSNVERLKSQKGDWESLSFDKKETRNAASPPLPRISSPIGSLERDLRLFGMGRMLESTDHFLSRTEAASPEPRYNREALGSSGEGCHTDRPKPSWDVLLRLKRAERERRVCPKSQSKPIINIHVDSARKLRAARGSFRERAMVSTGKLADRRATVQFVTGFETGKAKSEEKERCL